MSMDIHHDDAGAWITFAIVVAGIFAWCAIGEAILP